MFILREHIFPYTVRCQPAERYVLGAAKLHIENGNEK